MERPIQYHLLRRDELKYEVQIRDVKPADTLAELRVQLKDLSRDLPSDEICDTELDPSSELKEIGRRVEEIEVFFTQANPPFKSFNQIRAVAHHAFLRSRRRRSPFVAGRPIIV